MSEIMACLVALLVGGLIANTVLTVQDNRAQAIEIREQAAEIRDLHTRAAWVEKMCKLETERDT